LNFLVLLGIVVLLILMGRVFRKSMNTIENPQFVIEKPPMPKDVAATARTLDRWRGQGRISREDHERLLELCRQDAEPPSKS
jgi:hypothetical protein